ncbi:MAG: hypothetical protein M3Y13_05015 [Armatimonadota bacterium]|nr:hypothetical protein [Armatimonadota bacterium]
MPKNTKIILLVVMLLLVVGAGAGFSVWSRQSAQSNGIVAYHNTDMAAVHAALQRNPDDAAAHMSLALFQSSHQDAAGAIGELRTVLRLEPGNREATFQLGEELRRTGQTAEAAGLYQKLASIDDQWGQWSKKRLTRMQRSQP